jgi:hypothetical protein
VSRYLILTLPYHRQDYPPSIFEEACPWYGKAGRLYLASGSGKMARKKVKGFLGLVIALFVVASLILYGVLIALPKAEIQVSNLVVEPREVLVGDPVVVSADIENKGRADGDFQATLTINGDAWETKSLEVPAESAQSVSFTFTPTSLGEYQIALGGLTAFLFAKEGVLPSLYAGDRWVYRVSADGEESEVSYEVKGEATIKGMVTYVVGSSGESPLNPYDKSTSFLDKGTLYPISEEQSGTVDDIPVSEKIVIEQLIEGEPWPLVIGNGWEVSWSENFTSRNGLAVTTGERQLSRTFKVEGKEEVATGAGTFRCFKIMERDETDNVTGTWWYSDKAKREVKYELMEQGVPVIYELLSYKVSATPPATPPPELEFPSFTDYEESAFGYTISYPEGWKLEPEEGETGTVYVFTAGGARDLRFAWVRVSVIPVSATSTLDKVYQDIMAASGEADPKFELLDSIKVEAELPWYEATWNSWQEEVKLEGKTIMVLKGEQLFMVTGWVQAAYSGEYGSTFEKVIDSFGVKQS